MKIKNVFLLGLSAVALASCGGVKEPKAYKNEVKKADFLQKFQEAAKDNVLFHAFDEGKEPFSFVVESEGSLENLSTNLKGTTEYDKELVKESSNGSMKYDNSSKVLKSVSESKTEMKGDGSSGASESKSDTAMKLADGYGYQINNVTKTFIKNKASTEDVDKEFFYNVYYTVDVKIQNVLSQAYYTEEKDSKFYIDDNVYTFVVETKNSSDEIYSYSETYNYFYQIVLNDNSFEYFYKYDYEHLTETTKRTTHSSSHDVVSKKEVSVKAPDISKYLDVTPVLK